MSRVHCVACGTSVVVDPQGVCPEGHHVGSRGARVEAAMGSATSHPDEPEPWVYMIEELVEVGAGTNGHAASPPRQLRPLKRSTLSGATFDDEPADADALLRELHSLAAFDEQVAAPTPKADAPAPVEATPPPPPPTSAATPAATRPARLDRDAMTDAFAELSALEAFAREQDGARPNRNGHGTPRNGTNGHGSRPGPGLPARTGNGATAPASNPDRAGVRETAQEAPATDPDELAALFSSELGTEPPVRETTPTPTGDHEPGSASDQLDELFAAAVTPPTLHPREHRGPHRTTTPVSDPVSDHDQPTPAGPAGDEVPARSTQAAATSPHAPEVAGTPDPSETPGATPTAASPPSTAPMDLSSFTAKGGAGRKNGRKRRFGR